MSIEDFKYFLACFTALFSVVNPLSAMPVFLALTTNDTPAYRRYQARRASIFVAAILIFFLFAGGFVLNFFGISMEAIRIAGGVIIFRSGFILMNTIEKPNLTSKSRKEGMAKADISLTPLALPLLSGPGAIAATISLASESDRWLNYLIISLAIIVMALLCWLILRISEKLAPLLGNSGMETLSKIIGFIAMTIGVQFIVNGILPLAKRLA